jgi:hypothetical protein
MIPPTRRALEAVGRRNAQAAAAPVQAVLRRLIEQARPGPDGPPDPKRSFVGETNRLSFVSSFVPQGQYGGLRRYDIGHAAAPGPGENHGARLVMKHRPASDTAAPMPADGSNTVLLDGVESLRVRYFGALDQGTLSAWHDSWRHPVNLPLLVSLDVTFVRGDRRQRVVLIAGPALAP